jgi:hypothetical protein
MFGIMDDCYEASVVGAVFLALLNQNKMAHFVGR